MTDFDDLARRYIDAWNEKDPTARKAMLGELFTEDARYTDPLVDAESCAAIDDAIGAVQGQFPDFAFRLVGPVDAHHDQARFRWEAGPAGVDAPVGGFDVVVAAGDGRIRTVLGFLDKVPAPAA